MEDLRQRLLLARQRRLGSGLEPVEQREVAIAAQRLDDVPVGIGAVGLEPREQACRRLCVVAERGHLCPQPVEHHVEVARRAEVAAEPAELLAQRLRPLAIDERARRAEKRPQPPGRDAELMQVLGIVAAAGAGVVGEECPILGLERDPERLARRGVLRQLGRFGRAVQVERPVELRLQLAGLVGAGLAQLLGEPAQRPLVALEQLDLDLPEAAGDPLALEHRDAVVDDLGSPGEDPLATRAQAGDRHERAPRRNAGSRSTSSAGGRAGGPASSSSSRAASRGSFSCHSPAPSSTRCRKVTPWRARRRSGVSW